MRKKAISTSFFNRKKWNEDSFQLSLGETELSFGDELKGTLSIKSDVEFDIEKIWVRLSCEESLREKTTQFSTITII